LDWVNQGAEARRSVPLLPSPSRRGWPRAVKRAAIGKGGWRCLAPHGAEAAALDRHRHRHRRHGRAAPCRVAAYIIPRSLHLLHSTDQLFPPGSTAAHAHRGHVRVVAFGGSDGGGR
jgi:hypothetical protein